MIKKSLFFGLMVLLAGMALTAKSAQADVVVSCLDNEFTIKGDGPATVGDGFDGTLIITKPDGEILFLETGDDIGEIPAGSRIEVFEGEFSISSGGTELKLSADPKSGSVEVKSGSVEVLTKDGTIETLSQGSSYQMNSSGLSETIAEPTAAGSPGGGTAASDFQDVDSTNIEQSPSQ